MKQIDLQPNEYRSKRRSWLVRSILYKPVFLSIAAVLGVWCALTIGVTQQVGGFGRLPEWAYWALCPSLLITPLFFVFAVLNDGDREVIVEGQASAERSSRLAAQQGRAGRKLK